MEPLKGILKTNLGQILIIRIMTKIIISTADKVLSIL
jgi:hypothetical protein